MNSGILYAIAAFVLWGLLPVYWKVIEELPAMEILGHRMLWSAVVMLFLLWWTKRFAVIREVLTSKRLLKTFLLTALLISTNWLIYIWAVNNERVLEASLGYFINPLVNVILGMVFLGERLRRWQAVAVLCAATGVLYMTIEVGSFPWIALTLSLSFGTYGLLRKTATLGSVDGLAVESLLLLLPSIAYVFFLESSSSGSLLSGDTITQVFLLGAGPVTVVPLLLFASAARRLPLTTLGLLQYIGPSIGFILAVFVYREPFGHAQALAFSAIWLALAIYSIEGLHNARKNKSGD